MSAVHPDVIDELMQQGINQSRQADYVGAIQRFDQVLQQDPGQAIAYGHRCVARYRMGDRPGAIADCQKAATLYLQQGKTTEYQYALAVLNKLQVSEGDR